MNKIQQFIISVANVYISTPCACYVTIGHLNSIPVQWPNIPILDAAETFANEFVYLCSPVYVQEVLIIQVQINGAIY